MNIVKMVDDVNVIKELLETIAKEYGLQYITISTYNNHATCIIDVNGDYKHINL